MKHIQSFSFFLMDQCPVFDLWVSSSEVDPSKPYSLSHLAAPVFNPLRGALKLSPSTKDVLSALFRMPVLRKGFSKWECFWPKSNIVITSHTTKRDRLFCQLFYFFFEGGETLRVLALSFYYIFNYQNLFSTRIAHPDSAESTNCPLTSELNWNCSIYFLWNIRA